MKRAIIYVHGKGGSCTEAGSYSKNCPGYDMIGFDYEIDLPWIVKGSLQKEYKKETEIYDSVSVIANSIGAFFTMDSLQKFDIEKALFISPILDMEKLIRYMMDQAGVTEQVLSQEKEIQTGPGETLSWDYLEYVKNNKIQWDIPTHILYAEIGRASCRERV